MMAGSLQRRDHLLKFAGLAMIAGPAIAREEIPAMRHRRRPAFAPRVEALGLRAVPSIFIPAPNDQPPGSYIYDPDWMPPEPDPIDPAPFHPPTVG
jgi:hypothetical protein